MSSLRSLILVAAIAHTGCASYNLNVLAYRSQLIRGDYEHAERDLSEASRSPDRLLYLMESGLLAHYDGAYARSNTLLANAERVYDELFTRSAGRELTSLLTNDQVRSYRGDPFERVLIHYYRALNYWYSGLREDALVECRKANLKLASHAAEAAAAAQAVSGDAIGPSYQNDAFIHYVTGLFYEAMGEWNDASVSYRNARQAYGAYENLLGVSTPPILEADLAAVEQIADAFSIGQAPLPSKRAAGELVLFTEVGFVSRKTQRELNLPLYGTDIDVARRGELGTAARTVTGRWRSSHRSRRHPSIDYWLRVAFPEMSSAATRVRSVRVSSGQAESGSYMAEDIDAIAEKTFQDNLPAIQTRSVGRALAKYAATEGIRKKNKILGFLANLFTASVEAADTRSWVSLPGQIFIGKLMLPPGNHNIIVEAFDASGRPVGRRTLENVQVAPGQRTFRSVRLYS